MYGEFDPDKFIAIVFKEGVISTLFGLPEDGKSNIASVIMEMLVARGYNVYTIIHFFDFSRVTLAKEKGMLPESVKYVKKPDEVHVINTLGELLMGLLTTENNVVILDEGGLFASSSLGTSKKVRLLKETAFIIRHFSASLLIIAQSKNSIVPDLRERLVGYEMRIKNTGVNKNSPRLFTIATPTRVVDEYSGEERTKFAVAPGDSYVGIPLTRYPIDSKFTPDFDIEDIDIVEARRRLRGYDSLAVRENNTGANIIRDLIAESGVVQKSFKNAFTVSQMAKKRHVTNQTIIRWCKNGTMKHEKTNGGHYRILPD